MRHSNTERPEAARHVRKISKARIGLIAALIAAVCALGLSAGFAARGGKGQDDPASAGGPFTKDTAIEDVIESGAFDGYGRLLFPTEEGYYSGDTLGELDLTWYTGIDPDKTVEIVNTLYERAESGETIFYDIYSDEEKAADPAKKDTGLFLFRGTPGAKTAVVNAGGGFAYVGAMQDSFPVALELSKKGYNAAALIYRPGEETACEDLARAIAFLEEHAEALGVDMTDYTLWGGSAGARMADWVGTNGTAAYGEAAYPKPAAVITQYTGLTEVTGEEPPTYANVGSEDGIARADIMRRRIREIQSGGTDAEIEVFTGLGHGFGLGTGTKAEGWVDHAVTFWKAHMTTEDIARATSAEEAARPDIPARVQNVPDGWRGGAARQGTLEDLYYDTWESFTYADHETRLRKHAVVYLPYGYRGDRKYDVFYLMHGGWSDENTTLGTPDAPSAFKNVLDHAIESGRIRPLIIVCPTYNDTNENGRDSDDFSLALDLTEQFHQELRNDLMPAVEGKYSTYAESTTPEGFAASRDHRGFGGFSMGSVATWRTFQYCLDDFRWFLPMSCGTSLDDEKIWQAADGRDPSDYFVFVMTGTSDFAYADDKARTSAMADSGYFSDVDEDADGNFAFRVRKGFSHDAEAAETYTFNGLAAFFPA